MVAATVEQKMLIPWGEIADFSRVSRKDFFPGCANNRQILFYPLETKRTTFFATHLIGN